VIQSTPSRPVLNTVNAGSLLVVRFPGWQHTIAGDREVKQALRKTLLKYKLHQEQDLFDRAYEYIKQYY